MLVAYDETGRVIAYLDHLVTRGPTGHATGLVDFDGHEKSGRPLREIWNVEGAVGSGNWPEWLGPRVHQFTVELDDEKRIKALVHSGGHRRDRLAIEKAIAKVEPDEKGFRDIRHIVGGPGRPLFLDEKGRTRQR